MNYATDEAIKTANAHLNNVGLPSYTMLMCTLRYLLSQAELSDIGERNAAVLRAYEMTRQYLHAVQP